MHIIQKTLRNIYRLDAMSKLSNAKNINPLDDKWKEVEVDDTFLDVKRRDAWSKVSPVLPG